MLIFFIDNFIFSEVYWEDLVFMVIFIDWDMFVGEVIGFKWFFGIWFECI